MSVPDIWPDAALAAAMLADAEHVLTRAPEGSVPADLACHLQALLARVRQVEKERDRLHAVIVEHHSQKADDRCIEDDDLLYAAAGLPPCDRRVGSKEEMLENCKRFIENRCQGAGWRTYREIEEENARLRFALAKQHRLHIMLAQYLGDILRCLKATASNVELSRLRLSR